MYLSVEDSHVAPCVGSARSFHKLSVVIVVERQSAVVGLVLVYQVVCLQIRLQVDAQQNVPFHAWPPFCARLGL